MSGRVTPEHRALLAAVAGGASVREAAKVAASTSRDSRRWERASSEPDPLAALVTARLVPSWMALFLAEKSGGAALAVRAEAARSALRPDRGVSEMTFALSTLVFSAITGIATTGAINTFVMPVFDKYEPQLSHEINALPYLLFVVAFVLALLAFALRMTGHAELLRPRDLPMSLRLLRSSSRAKKPYEATAILWLAAGERAGIAAHDVFAELSRKNPQLTRYARLAIAGSSARAVMGAWASAGLLSSAVVRAIDGLWDHTSQPLDRLARLSSRSPDVSIIQSERGVIGAGVLCAALGAGIVAISVAQAIFRLGSGVP